MSFHHLIFLIYSVIPLQEEYHACHKIIVMTLERCSEEFGSKPLNTRPTEGELYSNVENVYANSQECVHIYHEPGRYMDDYAARLEYVTSNLLLGQFTLHLLKKVYLHMQEDRVRFLKMMGIPRPVLTYIVHVPVAGILCQPFLSYL